MKNKFNLAILGFIVLTFLSTNLYAKDISDRAKVNILIDKYEIATLSADPALMKEICTSDFYYDSATYPHMTLEQYLEDMKGWNYQDYRIINLEVQVTGKTAVATGSRETGEGHITFEMVKIGKQWKLNRLLYQD